MNKKSPIELFRDRIETLHNGHFILMETIIKFDAFWLKEKILDFCESQNHKNEFKIFFENKIAFAFNIILSDLEKLVLKIRNTYPIDHPLFALNVLKGGRELYIDEKNIVLETLMAEFDCYSLMIESLFGKEFITSKSEIILTKRKSKSGRKKLVSTFKGDKILSKEQINTFYNLVLNGRDKEDLFDVSKNGESQFFSILESDDVASCEKEKYEIKLAAENYLFAFVLTWFEKNGFFKSPFLAVENSSSFFSSDGKKIKSNDLAKAKSNYPIEKYITTVLPKKKIALPIPLDPKDNNQYFPYLNSLLHSYFH